MQEIVLATKTLEAIKAAIEADQGAAFRQKLKEILPKMEDAYRGEASPYRSHLGASLIGRDCTRSLWYDWRWCKRKIVDSRLTRLFNRGHLEEARFLAMLSILPNVQLWFETEDGGQFRFRDINGHFGSALDGVVMGIPDLPPNTPAYTEFKTSADKAFQKLVKEGVRNAKLEHFVQMQICMLEMKLPYSLYLAVNKNDDELYGEIITFDESFARIYLTRAESIIFTDKAPQKLHPNPSYYACKYCDNNAMCSGKAKAAINCRTCKYAQPSRENAGEWYCTLKGKPLVEEEAYYGCDNHTYLLDLT